MSAVLIVGDTLRSPEMRHEVPLGIGDPFLYLEADGRRVVLTNVLEVDRIARDAPELERLLGEQFGRDELIAAGLSWEAIDRELYVRAVRELGIASAVVPPDFPLAVADRLRAEGVELTPDDELFVERRRRKTDAELAGIRRAAHAAVAGVEECARVLREAEVEGDEPALRRAGARPPRRCAPACARCARAWARRLPTTSSWRRCAPATPSATTPAAGRCPHTHRSASTCGRRTRRRAAGPT